MTINDTLFIHPAMMQVILMHLFTLSVTAQQARNFTFYTLTDYCSNSGRESKHHVPLDFGCSLEVTRLLAVCGHSVLLLLQISRRARPRAPSTFPSSITFTFVSTGLSSIILWLFTFSHATLLSARIRALRLSDEIDETSMKFPSKHVNVARYIFFPPRMR